MKYRAQVRLVSTAQEICVAESWLLDHHVHHRTRGERSNDGWSEAGSAAMGSPGSWKLLTNLVCPPVGNIFQFLLNEDTIKGPILPFSPLLSITSFVKSAMGGTLERWGLVVTTLSQDVKSLLLSRLCVVLDKPFDFVGFSVPAYQMWSWTTWLLRFPGLTFFDSI